MDTTKRKVTISWSGGKDSAFALYKIIVSGAYEVVHLHTLINSDTKRVGLHGVPETLIERQAACIGLPLVKLYTPSSPDHDVYASCMRAFYKRCVHDGIEAIVFGDIFLEDLRDYRLTLLQGTPLAAEFPLWRIDSDVLIQDFMNTGFKTVVCSANAALMDKKTVGQTIDPYFVSFLREGVDPCGENGEFHTMVYDGPIFKKPLPFIAGDVVEKSYHYQKTNAAGEPESVEARYWFQDLLPV